jgi:4-hydroxy-2-oxoheptanedioate aldolase
MTDNLLKADLKKGVVAIGIWIVTPSPINAEFLALLGLDYLCIDCQHGPIAEDAIFSMIQAVARTGVAPIVRVPSARSDVLGRALDAGAVGVVVPMVNSVEEARVAVAACRYHPFGTRSYGPLRASIVLGSDPQHTDREVLCFVQIETSAGASAAEEICAIPGIDGVIIGPGDLALSIGIEPSSWQVNGIHREARSRIQQACVKADIVPGIFTDSWQDAVAAAGEGFRLLSVSTDLGLLLAAATEGLSAARGALRGVPGMALNERSDVQATKLQP